MAAEPNFLVAITARNVRPFLGALVASLASQTWPHWSAVFVDDGSTDGTLDMLDQLLAAHDLSARFEVIKNTERRHQAHNLFQAIKNSKSAGDVVAIVDGDDHLAADHAFERLAREYAAGWDAVWSNWRGTDGRLGTSNHLNPFLSPRQQSFVSGHLFTFRRRLFDAVQEADLQDDQGRWFEAAGDVAIAWPVLEQTIKRKHIPEVLYIYNRGNPASHARTPRLRATPEQARTCAILRKRRGKPLQVDQAFLQGHLYELLRAASASDRLWLRDQLRLALQQK